MLATDDWYGVDDNQSIYLRIEVRGGIGEILDLAQLLRVTQSESY